MVSRFAAFPVTTVNTWGIGSFGFVSACLMSHIMRLKIENKLFYRSGWRSNYNLPDAVFPRL
jgi:hypothetical protein